MPLTVRKFNAQVKDPDTGQMVPAGLLSSDSLEAIDTAKAAAINAIQQNGTQQVAAIQQKGVETRESIPDDYTELSDSVDELKTQISLFEIPLIQGHFITLAGDLSVGDTPQFSYTDFYNFTTKDKFEIFDFANLSYASYALGYAFYDKDRHFISGAGDFDGDLSSDSVTIPANSEYIRFCTRTQYVPNAKVYVNNSIGYIEKNRIFETGRFRFIEEK